MNTAAWVWVTALGVIVIFLVLGGNKKKVGKRRKLLFLGTIKGSD